MNEEPQLSECQTRQEELAAKFRHLADKWRKETASQSSLSAKFNHPAYRAVIGMGFEAVPLLLKELQTGSKHWAYALKQIVGFDPGSQAENPSDAALAWIQWGRNTKLIK